MQRYNWIMKLIIILFWRKFWPCGSMKILLKQYLAVGLIYLHCIWNYIFFFMLYFCHTYSEYIWSRMGAAKTRIVIRLIQYRKQKENCENKTLYLVLMQNKLKTRQVSSMIHSAGHTVSPVANIVLALFCFTRFWKVGTDGRATYVKTIIPTVTVGRSSGSIPYTLCLNSGEISKNKQCN